VIEIQFATAAMLVLLGILLIASWRSETAGDRIYNAFAPALSFIHHYMALFYAPLLVTLPQNASILIGVQDHIDTCRHWYTTIGVQALVACLAGGGC
jgi:hypothetical protein